MDAIVKKWGNSLGVRIPAFIAARAGIKMEHRLVLK